MAKTPEFDRITDTITQTDIDRFLKSAGPADFREEVLAATDQRTKMRFVAGYLIRTRQITPERLSGKAPAVAAEKGKSRTTATARASAKAALLAQQQQQQSGRGTE